jgi:hypothetical protein
MVPVEHRVRLATSEFTGFAIFWWNDLCTTPNNAVPQTRNALKKHMKSYFVTLNYQRDLCLKLQTLNQGDKGVTNCIILLLRLKEKYKDDDNNRIFRSNPGRSFLQRSDLDKPKAPVAKLPATPPATTPTFEVSNVSSMQSQPQKKVVSTGASSSRSTNIVCQICKGSRHVMKDCASHRAFIATNDGGYVSASDVEDDLALLANHVVDSESKEEANDPMTAVVGYKSIHV